MSVYGNTSYPPLDPTNFPTPDAYNPVDLSVPPTDEPPLYVNARQYHRILKRRLSRAKLDLLDSSKQKQAYKHESRHNHAMRRPRGIGGRFLTKQEIAELAEKEKEKEQNGETHIIQEAIVHPPPPRHAPLGIPHAIAPYNGSINNRRPLPHPSHHINTTNNNQHIYNNPQNGVFNSTANTNINNSNGSNNNMANFSSSVPHTNNIHYDSNNINTNVNNVNVNINHPNFVPPQPSQPITTNKRTAINNNNNTHYANYAPNSNNNNLVNLNNNINANINNNINNINNNIHDSIINNTNYVTTQYTNIPSFGPTFTPTDISPSSPSHQHNNSNSVNLSFYM